MNVVLDTSVIIAVITNESHKKRLIEMTKGAELITPSSLHWEVGNAFSAMFRRNRITLRQSIAALNEYRQIPLKFHDIDLAVAIQLSHRFRIYAYDAYFLACSLKNNSPPHIFRQQLG